ncbi:MAG: TIR domain-containing protein [Acidimicrobiales bacterium]
MGGVFISYRRDDSQGSTGRIADRLHELLGDEIPLFLDIDSIRPGQDFREVISHTLAQCDVTLVMIGPRWLDVTDDEGNLRLTDEADLHRMEVESALASSATTIPVLVEGAAMPGPGDLPESIRELAYLHAAEVSVRRFAADASYLAELIRGVVAAEPTGAADEPPAAVVEPEASVPAAPPVPAAVMSAETPVEPVEPVEPAEAVEPAETGEPGRPGPDRRLLAAGAVVVVLAIIGLAVAFSGDDGGGDPPASEPLSVSVPDGTATDPTGVDVFSLEVGDCFGPVESTLVATVEPLDCAGLHANEVYAIWNSFTATLPADEELLAGCVARFDEAVGIPYNFSAYYVAGFWPDAESWRDGRRTVICYGFVRDGQGAPIATTGSMLGSGN